MYDGMVPMAIATLLIFICRCPVFLVLSWDGCGSWVVRYNRYYVLLLFVTMAYSD